MAFVMTDIQHFPIELEADDGAGNAVPFQFATPPTWTSSHPEILTVSPNEDGSNADVSTTGKLGDAQINVQGTNEAGEPVLGILDVTVATSRAKTFRFKAGTAVDK